MNPHIALGKNLISALIQLGLANTVTQSHLLGLLELVINLGGRNGKHLCLLILQPIMLEPVHTQIPDGTDRYSLLLILQERHSHAFDPRLVVHTHVNDNLEHNEMQVQVFVDVFQFGFQLDVVVLRMVVGTVVADEVGC